MKRSLAVFSALLVLFLCGCSSKGNVSSVASQSPDVSSVVSVTSVASVDSTEAGASGNISGILQLLQPAFDQINEASKSTMTMTATEVDDSTLMMTYQYSIDVGDLSAVKSALEASKDTLAASVSPMLGVMKQQGIASPTIIVEYKGKDGSLITSMTFVD